MNQSETIVNESLDANATNATTRFQASNEGMAVAYGSLLFMALFPIIVGSFKSVTHVNKQKQTGKTEEVEVMTNKDAMMFPVYGSFVLFGIYLVFRFIDKDLVNVLFTAYFFILGVIALARVIEPLVKKIPLPCNVTYKVLMLSDEAAPAKKAGEKSNEEDAETFVAAMNAVLQNSEENSNQVEESPSASGDKVKSKDQNVASFSAQEKRTTFRDLIINYDFDYFTVLSFVLSICVGVWYLLKKHWIANNLFGLAFSISGIEFLQLNSVLNGCILLVGLFIYDVCWVFGTDVMVTVAKSLEAPIKLIVPQDLPEKGLDAGNFAMLGLGDIVIPGIFVALCLRIDYSFAVNKVLKRVYFWSAFSAYILGLVVTISVMHYFKHAQPALLYLVPSCLGIPLFVALTRGELKPMFDYLDTEEQGKENSTKNVGNEKASIKSKKDK